MTGFRGFREFRFLGRPLEGHQIWTIKAQPTEVHNNTTTQVQVQVVQLVKLRLH